MQARNLVVAFRLTAYEDKYIHCALFLDQLVQTYRRQGVQKLTAT